MTIKVIEDLKEFEKGKDQEFISENKKVDSNLEDLKQKLKADLSSYEDKQKQVISDAITIAANNAVNEAKQYIDNIDGQLKTLESEAETNTDKAVAKIFEELINV